METLVWSASKCIMAGYVNKPLQKCFSAKNMQPLYDFLLNYLFSDNYFDNDFPLINDNIHSDISTQMWFFLLPSNGITNYMQVIDNISKPSWWLSAQCLYIHGAIKTTLILWSGFLFVFSLGSYIMATQSAVIFSLRPAKKKFASGHFCFK